MENDYDKEDREFAKEKDEGYYQPVADPESEGEAARKSGLAYGAVIFLVGAILIFLAIGWGLDKVFNTSPWLLVAGIILGAILGFYQFIRISSKLN